MRILTLTLALVVCATGASAVQKGRKPVTHTVTIDATSFSPATLRVAAGDSVVWVNKDVIPHTATSQRPGVFDSGTIASGKSWQTTFKTKGQLAYVCTFHPTMKATVHVK